MTEQDVLAQAEAGVLPAACRVQLSSRTLAPLFRPGREILLARRPPKRGDLVCLAGAKRLVWRRVLEVRGEEVRLRAEVAPFEDGWHRGILACVETCGLLSRLAALAPGLWTAALWQVALAVSRLKGLAANLTAGTLPDGLETRLLAPGDAPAFAALQEKARGFMPPALPEGSITLGLFQGPVLIGAICATPEGAGWSPWMVLVIDPAYRGRGCGRRLLEAFLAESKRRGIRRVICLPPARHRASRGMVFGAGFRWTGLWWRGGADPFEAAERQLLEAEAVLDYDGARP